MDLEMVLNELSLQPLANDVQIARQRMIDLITTLQAATTRGIKRELLTHDNLNNVFLAPDYPLARWRNDNEVDREARRFFSRLSTNYPIPASVTDPEVKKKVDTSDFLHENDRATGLGIAFLLNGLALSLRSEQRWYSSHLELDFIQLDDDGEIIEELVEVIHASQRDHVLEHAGWIKSRIASVIRNGSDVWEYRKQLFPNLQFCTSVREQLLVLNSGNSPLRLIEKKLSDLEACCKDWQERGSVFDLRQIPGKCAPESEATLNEYGHQRTFHCPDGVMRVFSLHVRITSYWRLHFLPLEGQKQIIIGYIGEHLPTAKFHM